MEMNNLLKDFALCLESHNLVIANEDELSQTPPDDYSFAKTIFTQREIFVPLLCRLAMGIREGNTPIAYTISYKGGMVIVRQFLQNIVEQFLENLKEKEFVTEWRRKSDCQYEVSIPKDEAKRRFFRSMWAEQVFRYVIAKTVQTFCAERKLSTKTFQNVKLRKKGEDLLFTELDLVVQVEERFYIFEVKSGPQINIIQWAKREQALAGNNIRNIVCTIHDSISEKIFEPQLLLKLGNIEMELKKMLDSDFSDEQI